jgi:hypothetical protein
MKLAYFVHEIEDPAVRRRVRMLKAGGAEPALFGFERGRHGAPTAEGPPPHVLGRTTSGRFLARIGSVVLALPRAWALRALWRDADVILARNLEMLAIVVALRGLVGAPGRVVYECLDIHRLMFSQGAPGKILRATERALLARTAQVLTSSPAFAERYFRVVQKHEGEILVVENKVLALEPASDVRKPPPPPPGPPWRIAWCGVLRCRKSLGILAAAARALEGRLEVDLWGAPALDQIPDFHAVVEATDHMRFHGRYAVEDLPRIYGAAHFVWAMDYYEAGGNSDWLLPNRLYEGLRQGVPPVAVSGVETARWLERNGVGVVLPEPVEGAVIRFIDAEAASRYPALRAAAETLDPRATALTLEDCRALVASLAGVPSAP